MEDLVLNEYDNIDFTYMKQPPKRYTFQQPKLKRWVELWCEGRVLNLFAGEVELNANETRVDIDEDMNADYYMDAYEFINKWDGDPFKTVVLDPPYNVRKSREKYDGDWIGSYTKIKNELNNILKTNNIAISLGYSTVGMSDKRGYDKKAICLVCHGGDHNDTIGLVEKKTQVGIDKYE